MGPGSAAGTGRGQIRIKVKAAGISPPDLALRAGYLKDAIPLPAKAVLGFEVAGTVNALGPGVTGTFVGDSVAALLFSIGGYAEYAIASTWPASRVRRGRKGRPSRRDRASWRTEAGRHVVGPGCP